VAVEPVLLVPAGLVFWLAEPSFSVSVDPSFEVLVAWALAALASLFSESSFLVLVALFFWVFAARASLFLAAIFSALVTPVLAVFVLAAV